MKIENIAGPSLLHISVCPITRQFTSHHNLIIHFLTEIACQRDRLCRKRNSACFFGFFYLYMNWNLKKYLNLI